MILHDFVLPADEVEDRPRSSVVGREVYDAWVKAKKKDPSLTQRVFADRLGLNVTQVKNALRRQRKARGVVKEKGRQYRDE